MLIRYSLLAVTLLAGLLTVQAQEMLVSGSWLAERLKDPAIVVMHVGTQEDYSEGHIPGARLVRLEDVTVTSKGGLRTELPPLESLQKALEKHGVTDEARVIIYSSGREIQSATRVWFTLEYVGLGNCIAMLDGGLPLWRNEGRPLSKDAVPGATSSFTPRPEPARVASAEWVRMHLNDSAVMVVDARTAEYYSGADKGMMPRAGRIPGARSATYSTFFKEDGTLKPREELRALLGVGKSGPEPVRVTYCHVGRQATVPYFVARYLGLEARVFDGSFQEWSQRKSFPVETSKTAE